MPVFGLPSALESSLNTLIDLRPPTSWRVSGHGRQEVTVVVRWTLHVISPSSEKTLQYEEADKTPPTARVARPISVRPASLDQESCPLFARQRATVDLGSKGETKLPSLLRQARQHLQFLDRGDSQSSGCFSQNNPANFQDNLWVDPDLDDCLPAAKKQRRRNNNIPYHIYRNSSFGSSCSTNNPNRRLSAVEGRAALSGSNRNGREDNGKHKSAFRSTFSVSDSPNCLVSSASSVRVESVDNNDSQNFRLNNSSSIENERDDIPPHKISMVPVARFSSSKSIQNKHLSGFQHIEADKIASFSDGITHPFYYPTPKPTYANSCSDVKTRDDRKKDIIIHRSFSHSPILRDNLRQKKMKTITSGNDAHDANISPESVLDVDGLNITYQDGTNSGDVYNNHQRKNTHTGPKKVHTQMKTVQHIVLPGISIRQRPHDAEGSHDTENKLRNGIRAYLAKCGSSDSSQVELCDLVDNNDDDDEEDNYDFTENRGIRTPAGHRSSEVERQHEDREKKLDERSGLFIPVSNANEDFNDSSPQHSSQIEARAFCQSGRNHQHNSFQKEYISNLEKQLNRRLSRHASIDLGDCQLDISPEEDLPSVDTNAASKDMGLSSDPTSQSIEMEIGNDVICSTSSPSVIGGQECQEKVNKDNQRRVNLAGSGQIEDTFDNKTLGAQDSSLEDYGGKRTPSSDCCHNTPESSLRETINVITADVVDGVENGHTAVCTSESTCCQDELIYDSDQAPGEDEETSEEKNLDYSDSRGSEDHKSGVKQTTGTKINNDTNHESTGADEEETIKEQRKVEDSDQEVCNTNDDVCAPEVMIGRVKEKQYEETEVCVEVKKIHEEEKEEELQAKGGIGVQHSTLACNQNHGSESPAKAIGDSSEKGLDCPLEVQCVVEVCSEKDDINESDNTSESHYLIDLSPQKEDIGDSVNSSEEHQAGEGQVIDKMNRNSPVTRGETRKCELRIEENQNRRWNINKDKIIADCGSDETGVSNGHSYCLEKRQVSDDGTSYLQSDTLKTNNNETVKKSPHRHKKRRRGHSSSTHHSPRSPSPFYSPKQTLTCPEKEIAHRSPCASPATPPIHSTRRKAKGDGKVTSLTDSQSKSSSRSSRKKAKAMKKSQRFSAQNSPNLSGNPSLHKQEKSYLHSHQLSPSKPNPEDGRLSRSPSIYSSPRSPHEISSTCAFERVQCSPGKVVGEQISREPSPSVGNIRLTNNTLDSRHPAKTNSKTRRTQEKDGHIDYSPQVTLVRIEQSMHAIVPKKRYRQESHDSDCPASRHYRKKDKNKKRSSKSLRHEPLQTSPQHGSVESEEIRPADPVVHSPKSSRSTSLSPQPVTDNVDADSSKHSHPIKTHRLRQRRDSLRSEEGDIEENSNKMSPPHKIKKHRFRHRSGSPRSEEDDAEVKYKKLRLRHQCGSLQSDEDDTKETSRKHSHSQKTLRLRERDDSLRTEEDDTDWNSTCDSSRYQRNNSPDNATRTTYNDRPGSEFVDSFIRSSSFQNTSTALNFEDRVGSTSGGKTPESDKKDTFDKSSVASSPPCQEIEPAESPLGFACESFEHLPEGNDVKLDDSSSDEASIRPPTPLT
ncbi:hypothetical protein EGW08_017311 [Elysia chlorotica]|uniref:Uncharacterized protein n=1 Tax=Elysia chlorotica TaxID=188477 RepID=A0A433T059_ELYCH|nr:hypothetical protein EGW08_017311 [Elysia chlorotica]